jgi:hypothetical protein
MLRFFRRIRIKLLAQGNLKKYLLYAIGEILLVVIGILIALQINNLNQERKQNNLTSIYLNNLKLDLLYDLETIKDGMNKLAFYEEEGYYSLNVIEGKIIEVDKTRFLKSLIYNNHFQPIQPSRSTYQDLISSGNIKLIKNNDLKVALAKYYQENDWWEQFGQRAKDTYWYVMREEMFKYVDPKVMQAFYETEYYPAKVSTVKYEDIDVDLESIKTQESLRKAISRALSLRIWHKNRLDEASEEIKEILTMLII